jgi:ABC-type transport system substrate-binding protein
VQFTFRSILDGSVHTFKSGHPFNLITAIDMPDPETVIFKLKKPFAPFL